MLNFVAAKKPTFEPEKKAVGRKVWMNLKREIFCSGEKNAMDRN